MILTACIVLRCARFSLRPSALIRRDRSIHDNVLYLDQTLLVVISDSGLSIRTITCSVS